MQFALPGEEVKVSQPIILDDSNMKLCFDTLAEGRSNILVQCRPGYLRELITFVHENYIMVKAAGGLVHNGEGLRLLMTRNGRADLPKGKVEKGETLAEAALRETEEETGLSHLTLGHLVLKSYHIYDLYGGWHFKQTSWFDMLQTENQQMVPQTEEGITEVVWLPDQEWRKRLENSYATMKEIVSYMTDL